MNNNIFLITFLIISCLTSAQIREINSIDSIYDSQIKNVNSLDYKSISLNGYIFRVVYKGFLCIKNCWKIYTI